MFYTSANPITRDQAEPPLFVGVDLGGTNIKVGVIDNQGRTLSYLHTPTQVERGAEDGARRMGEAVLKVIEQAGLKPADIARVGLGSPGTMDIPAGMLLKPINLHGWNDFPLRDRVSHYCSLPVSFENDANAAAYGEYWVGSGREFHSMVLFTLGTGIGSGIVIGDALIDGQHSHGAECGHMVIDFADDARLCGCGRRGHLEAYASATAGFKSSLAVRLERGEPLTPLLVAEEAATGDRLSLEIVIDTARYLGVGVVNVMHTIDPDGVVLGGAMTFGGHDAPLGRKFLARVKQEVEARALPVPAEKTVIDFAALGGDAGYIGAAGIARLDYRHQS
jgi:glucokinase